MARPRPVAVDTDPGVDDALALLLALRSPELEVVLVTTVAGNVRVGLATANARRVVGLEGPEPPPVVRGAARPLARPLRTAVRVHGEDGLGAATALWASGRGMPAPAPLAAGEAAEALVECARRHRGALTLVALGPLTNLARALAIDARAMRRVGRVVVMGGAVEAPGNVTPCAEFNFHVDPEAADRVLGAGLPLTLVPLDVTRRVVLSGEALRAGLGRGRSPRARLVRAMGGALLGRRGAPGMPLHDPLAVAVAVRPDLVRVEPRSLAVEPAGRYTAGMCVPDPGRPPVAAALGVEAAAVLDLVSERVLGARTPGRARPRPRVAVVGSANVDLAVLAPRLPAAGETVSGGVAHRSLGGKGANQAIAAARAGAAVAFVGRVGADDDGERYARHLCAEGIDTRGLGRDPARATGLALIAVDRRGRNQIVVAPGANHALGPADLAGLEAALVGAGVLVSQLEIPLPAVEAALAAGRAAGWRTVLNAAPVRPLPRRLARRVDVLVANEIEAAALAGRPVAGAASARAALRALLARGYGAGVITLGRRGCVWAKPGAAGRVAGLAVDVVDTTGAGDAFVGYLACALAEGRPLGEACTIANTAAALSVTAPGAQGAVPPRAAVERRPGRAGAGRAVRRLRRAPPAGRLGRGCGARGSTCG